MMLARRKALVLAVLVTGLVGVLGALVGISVSRYYELRPLYLRGAVIKQEDDPMKESPITDVEVGVADNLAAEETKSDFSGFFSIRLRRGLSRNQTRHTQVPASGVPAIGLD